MGENLLGQDRTGYAICTSARSGSNWIGQALSSTRRLGCPLEYFNASGRRWTDPAYPEDVPSQMARVLTDGTSENGVYALKIFPSHLDVVAQHMNWTNELPNLRFVRWVRRDLLGQALSRSRVIQTGQYRSTQTSLVAPIYDGVAILAQLRIIVREYARWDMFFARNAIVPLSIFYEDAVDDVQGAVDRVSHFIGLRDAPKVDLAGIDLVQQRDDLTSVWRAQFLAEFAWPNAIDDI